MRRFNKAGAFALAIGTAVTVNAGALADNPDADPAALHTRLDAAVPEMLTRHEVPSAAIAYISDGQVQWAANWGERAPGEAAGPQTLYNIASVTKAIVAEAILRAAAEERLNLDLPMAPVFVDPDLHDDPRAGELTPAMALSHRTGFAENWRSDMPDGKLAITDTPGETASYSGENLEYVAAYATETLGVSLEELVAAQVFEAAQMTDTWFTPDPAWEGRVAMVRGRDGALRLPNHVEEASAADDVHTTIGDLGNFVAWAMRGDHLTQTVIAARDTIYDDQVAQACPPGVIPPALCPAHTGFGLGWMIYDSGDNRFLLHNGKGWGERAIALFEPEKGYGVVVLTSGANGRSVISEVLQITVPDEKLNVLVAAEARFDR